MLYAGRRVHPTLTLSHYPAPKPMSASTCLRVQQSPYPYLKPLRVYVTETAFLGGCFTAVAQVSVTIANPRTRRA
ncbi:MAG: hypothetical protein C4323_20230 [Mastigocladus sp. ERB_26_2]